MSERERERDGLSRGAQVHQESRASIGLGQYAQHTCCATHANAHLNPFTISREETGGGGVGQGKDEDWFQLVGVALRADRAIREGEEILIQYVGVGRSGHFRKVFECMCCRCSGRCSQSTRSSEGVWINTVDRINTEEEMRSLREMERQIVTDRNNLPGLRRAFPGTTKRTGPDRTIKGSVATTVWGGSAMQLPLSELYNIGNMEGMLSGIVINQLHSSNRGSGQH